MGSRTVQRALRDEGEAGKGTDLLGRTAGDKLLVKFSSYLVDELGRSPNTAQGYVWYIKRACKSLNKPCHRINADDLRRFLQETDYAQSTKRGVIVAFHQFHDYGVTDGLWKRNGISTLKTPKVPREPRAPLKQEDAYRLLANSLSPVQARIAYLGLYAGLRVRGTSRDQGRTLAGRRTHRRAGRSPRLGRSANSPSTRSSTSRGSSSCRIHRPKGPAPRCSPISATVFD